MIVSEDPSKWNSEERILQKRKSLQPTQSLLCWESDPSTWRVAPLNLRVLHSNHGWCRKIPDAPSAVMDVHLGIFSPGL